MNATSEVLMFDSNEKVQTKDLIVETAFQVENLDAKTALATVTDLQNAVDKDYFYLGGVLSVIQSNKYYESVGYNNFKELVEGMYGIPYRKAMYLISIYNSLVSASISWVKVAGLGWTKLKELAPILTTSNVDEWVEIAKDLTVLQLQERVKKAQEQALQTSGLTPEESPSTVTTFTAKVHKDQKETIQQAIEKAMKESQTEFPGVALEAICINYLSGGNVKMGLKDTLKKYEFEEVLTAVDKVFPDYDITVSLKPKK